MIRPIISPSASLSKIANLIGAEFDQELEISGISQNADDCLPGDLFVAIKGNKFHGIAFLDQAIKNGAVAVLTDKEGANSSLPTLIVENPRLVVGEIASYIFGEPSANLFSVGITGTNGKTTVTTLLHQIWQKANWDSGLIGTVNTQINSEVLPSIHTTPEASALQGILAAMRERHCRAVAMEVSSHALVQNRVNGTHFNIAGFTNLTQDHLDFHGDMESYFKAKAKLFTFGRSDLAVINIDDQYGAKLAQVIDIPVLKISRTGKADWRYEEIINFGASTQVKIRGRDGVLIEGQTKLLGDFNLDNLLMAVAIAVMSGVDPIEISANLVSYTGAPGRLEQINVGQKFLAFVDYAHTPDAVDNVLRSARAMTKGNVIAVLGCGGDRDKTKRPLMGKALTAADLPIFTSDNPRSEDPEVILQEMVGNLRHSGHVIVDRKAAIEMAISIAKPGDVVAVLGKGHETGQEIAGIKHPFDDRKVLAEAIAGGQMIKLKISQIADIVNGKLNAEGAKEVWSAPVFDSRKATEGSFFLALQGENADGHDFIESAINNGAVFALVSREVPYPSIQVDNVLEALATLAAYVRLQLPNLTVIGITGSQGKTTTKDLLQHMLESIGTTISPENSFNNELGAPLNLLRCDENTKFCIAELGARHLGDIRRLSSVVKPDIGVVLRVGSAHLSEFGSVENIAKTKRELIESLPTDGIAVLGTYDEYTPRMSEVFSGRIITFGEIATADVRATDIEIREGSPHFDIVNAEGRVSVGMRLIGAHQIPNALAAAAVGVALGISNDHIATALSTAVNKSKWRMQLHELPGLLVINDAYNANPDSMEGALFSLRLFAQERGGSAWAFLGKMHELGASSGQAHEKIGTLARDLGVDHLVAINAPEYGASLNFKNWEAALELAKEISPGDVVLVKASRAEGLEKLAEALIAGWGS